MGQRPSRVMQMQFHSECMEKYCRVLSRQVKDLIYIKNTTLAVFWKMEWREVRAKLGRIVQFIVVFQVRDDND